jgi:hypothetical protein
MTKFLSSAFLLASLACSGEAFAPISQARTSQTELGATLDRRNLLGAIGVAIGGALVGTNPADASNPALETFKGGKKTKGSFIPGKGIRLQEENLITSNPALETFKGGKKTKGSFIPGKGIRQQEESIMMASNPALETFKGRPRTKGSFIPGKGIRQQEDPVMMASNPALETFKGRPRTKGSFIPGKGIRQHEEYVMMASNPALETFKGGKKTKGSFIPVSIESCVAGYRVFVPSLVHRLFPSCSRTTGERNSQPRRVPRLKPFEGVETCYECFETIHRWSLRTGKDSG